MAITIMGRTMNLEVLKQPRGFLRFLQCFFALLAFAVCCGYGSHLDFEIKCLNETLPSVKVNASYSYPFKLDHIQTQNFTVCGQEASVSFPGDFSSDAQFFVFIGVVCWLYCLATLFFYLFMGDLYEQKSMPVIDLALAAVIAFLWLASSSAWGHGLSGLKSSGDPANWIYQNGETALAKICAKSVNGGYVNTGIASCDATFTGNYAGGNISVVIGFLNVFLWAANIWFLYKETSWFHPNTGNLQNMESPTGSI